MLLIFCNFNSILHYTGKVTAYCCYTLIVSAI